MIDAQTGSELKRWEDQPQGRYRPGATSRPASISTAPTLALQVDDNCRMTGTNVDTLNMNHGTTGAPSTSSPARRTRSEISGAYSPLNDAHYFGNVVCSTCTANWYNTAPLSFKLKMRVHYSRNYEKRLLGRQPDDLRRRGHHLLSRW